VTLYFRKEDLPAALAQEMFERMVEAAEAASQRVDDLPDAVEAMVRAIYAVAEDYRDALVAINRAVELVDSESRGASARRRSPATSRASCGASRRRGRLGPT
jgi:AcrR family transcriptional regulator